jgi:hypothetical protein
MTARIEPTKDRPVPGPSIEAQLVAEVDRTAARHEAALLDLRRWRISHPPDE